MAERSDDMNIDSDENVGTGEIKRTLTLKQHHTFNTANWSGMRAAAVTSESALLSWLDTNDHDAYVWINGMSAGQKSAARRAILREA